MGFELEKHLKDSLCTLSKSLKDFGELAEVRYCIPQTELDLMELSNLDYDDSDWTLLDGAPFRREQGLTWARMTYTVPESCGDIPLAGSQLRVFPMTEGPYFSPVKIYCDGCLLLEESAWMDCKCPEGIVSESAIPGQTHVIVCSFDFTEISFWDLSFSMKVMSDRVETRAIHIASIVEELEFAAGFAGTEGAVQKACSLLEAELQHGATAPVMQAITEARKLFEPFRETIKRSQVHLITHAHIDMNWFWPMEETERVIDRDFTTMTALMDEYEDFTFSQSQSVTYAITERNNPALFRKMQKYVREGRWDSTASTWVEGDQNMACGEAMVRQVLYAKQYMQEKFNVEPRIMWNPDAFGHPASLPQILKKSGIRYYFFMRCGNGTHHTPYNDFAYVRDVHHTPLFWWKGQDGSRVLAANLVYNCDLNTRGVLRLSAAMRQRFGYNKAMYVFGVGDHGGGATKRDIAWMRELNSLPTTPTLLFSTTDRFYSQVEEDRPALPEFSGEMNVVFEGCYTTHADIKWYNRRCECDLEAIEKLCAVASLNGYQYPAAELAELWRPVLFNQFHDIFDGTGVPDSYRFSNAEAEKVLARLREIESDAMLQMGARANVDTAKGQPLLVFNPVSAVRDACIVVQGDHTACDRDGNALPTQRCAEGTRVWVQGIPSLGCAVLYLQEKQTAKSTHVTEDASSYYVETAYYSVEILKKSGEITTLYDKHNGRYVVCKETFGYKPRKGILNTLQMHYEEPTPMASWTIGSVNRVINLISGAESSIVEDGQVGARIRFIHHIDSSTITQDIVIPADGPRIDFETRVDWQEYGNRDREAPMLKVYFAPDIQNSTAECEIPYGVLSRVTGDWEFPALRWVDISEGAYGFALLNDSKHGYKCRGNGLELSLIRSGWTPDPKSDVGSHHFTYSILPHTGGWEEGKVPQQAGFLNHPLRVKLVDAGSEHVPAGANNLLSLETDAVEVTAVKCSEKGDGLLVRICNPTDREILSRVQCGFALRGVMECDLLERGDLEVECYERSFPVRFGPHEVKSYRILL